MPNRDHSPDDESGGHENNSRGPESNSRIIFQTNENQSDEQHNPFEWVTIEKTPSSTPDRRISRRTVLRAVGTVGATVTAWARGFATPSAAVESKDSTDTEQSSSNVHQRMEAEYETRNGCARSHLVDTDAPVHASNSRISEQAVVSKFGKSLVHDQATGLPTTEAYESLVTACEQGQGYDQIQQASLDQYDVDASGIDAIDPPPFVDEPHNLSPKPLIQPESAWAYMAEGASTAQLQIAVPPAFDSEETGAEMVELYWRALTRDVPFHEYGDNDIVEDAARELDSIAGYKGPGSDADPTSDTVDTDNVFRGITPGAQAGPYVSQMLWKDRNLGGGPEDQKIQPQIAETTPRNYMTTVEDWLKVQNGVVPGVDRNLPSNEYADTKRHIITGRDMCERVHDDPPFRQIQKAAQVLIFSMQAPLDESIPYTLKPFEKRNVFDVVEGEDLVEETKPSSREVDSFLSQTRLPFNDFGPLYIEKKAVEATEHGQKAAWHKKWNVHRRLRPEEYGGRVHAIKDGSWRSGGLVAPEEYPIPDNLLDSEALEESRRKFGSYLLPQAYAEGSPTHPSYPAGHSVVAGAGVTVLKAFFDGDYVFPADEKVVPTRDGSELVAADDLSDTTLGLAHDIYDELTVRGELNKLASNMALGRNRAGIHYRSDGIEGLRLGEAAAIRFLEDQLELLNHTGEIRLSLETFDGEEITVEPTLK